ncbi:Palmitoyltransferase [Favolaschia claudopus]|uniref:Palmitoyltransferase n=1 Tax=Favolaschia claudopus TaxID=2862362 RepID=A0AAV9ZXE7_9AGAR
MLAAQDAEDKERTFCGTITEARIAARERRESKPQPWLVQKLTVAITFGIMGYTGYVYAGRFSRRLMDGRKATGIGLLVGWSILYAWMVWAYVKVIFTPPGKATDYVAKVSRPLLPAPEWEQPGQIYADADSFDETAVADIDAGRIGPTVLPPAHHPDGAPAHPPVPNPLPNGRPPRRKSSSRPPVRDRYPSRANLLEPHRYCSRCSIIKPHRAHHCRICGTCILKFDHHCPWIGQCVGARNHKFFLNFNLAAFAFTIYTFASLLAFNVGGRNGGDTDPQEVVIIALAALFALFTATLAIEHTRMILFSQTTVESLAIRRQKERDHAGLEASGIACWDFQSRRAALRTYDAEWGAPDKEGNPWWPGSKRKGWEDTMGRGRWGWICE